MSGKKKIIELVDVIRSKNAGPYQITFDFIFKSFAIYEQVKELGVINAELIAQLYKIEVDDVISVINYDPAKAIKATIVRAYPSGAVGDSDVYGAQQHAPLLDVEIEI